MVFPKKVVDRLGDFAEMKRTMLRPRHFKTHFPVEFLPDQIWEKEPKVGIHLHITALGPHAAL
jgi:hypothetical protein